MGTEESREEDDFPEVDLDELGDSLEGLRALIDSLDKYNLWGTIYDDGSESLEEMSRRIDGDSTINEVRDSGDYGPVSRSSSLPVVLTVSISPESLSRLQERLSRFREIIQADGLPITKTRTVKPIKTAEQATEDFGDFIYWRTRTRE